MNCLPNALGQRFLRKAGGCGQKKKRNFIMRRTLQPMGAGSVSARIGEVPKICQLVRHFLR